MRRRSNNRTAGFTLVEVMMASALVAVAIVGVMGGIRALTKADTRAKDAALLQRLAEEKISDARILADPSDIGSQGDFGDRGYADVTWTANITSTSITNLDQVTVIATRGNESQSLTTQLYVPSTSALSTTSTSTTGAAQ